MEFSVIFSRSRAQSVYAVGRRGGVYVAVFIMKLGIENLVTGPVGSWQQSGVNLCGVWKLGVFSWLLPPGP